MDMLLGCSVINFKKNNVGRIKLILGNIILRNHIYIYIYIYVYIYNRGTKGQNVSE